MKLFFRLKLSLVHDGWQKVGDDSAQNRREPQALRRQIAEATQHQRAEMGAW